MWRCPQSYRLGQEPSTQLTDWTIGKSVHNFNYRLVFMPMFEYSWNVLLKSELNANADDQVIVSPITHSIVNVSVAVAIGDTNSTSSYLDGTGNTRTYLFQLSLVKSQNKHKSPNRPPNDGLHESNWHTDQILKQTSTQRSVWRAILSFERRTFMQSVE